MGSTNLLPLPGYCTANTWIEDGNASYQAWKAAAELPENGKQKRVNFGDACKSVVASHGEPVFTNLFRWAILFCSEKKSAVTLWTILRSKMVHPSEPPTW
mmetsp:Transcript_8243/g.11354  ORF Transcript_8243/g.11354 Transcript_8243/m.11354 type:complete len:100 (+) Transcript_8243:375-674(+)